MEKLLPGCSGEALSPYIASIKTWQIMAIGMSIEDRVTVDGEELSIYIIKTGSTTWKATGTFRGKQIIASGHSVSEARKNWKSRAEYAAKE